MEGARLQRLFLSCWLGARGRVEGGDGCPDFPALYSYPVKLLGGEYYIPQKLPHPPTFLGWQGMSCFTIIKGVRY
jgi:hypothetical protein